MDNKSKWTFLKTTQTNNQEVHAKFSTLLIKGMSNHN
jgi:hypothetical protein